ncbi:hypothetical protein RB195_007832 [Necator americanus]|uniref:Uncharacterized protein n=1 Tax=Necator americanus TaxID=51031 RepID=A0ABR1BZ46_NECAM
MGCAVLIRSALAISDTTPPTINTHKRRSGHRQRRRSMGAQQIFASLRAILSDSVSLSVESSTDELELGIWGKLTVTITHYLSQYKSG